MVDNASTDHTGEFATASWPSGTNQVPRVVRECRPGLSFAYERGLNEAQYEYVCFVDDDNWIAANWLIELWHVMKAHPEAGVVGSYSESVCETPPPPWLVKVGRWLALGPQADGESDVTETVGSLWGAGMTVRKSAWLHLAQNGFQFRLTDRRGDSLSAGGEDELCLALRIVGWRLWYCPTLRLQHFMPARRLNWPYMLQLARGAGDSSLWLDAYYRVLRNDMRASFVKRGKAFVLGCWVGQVVATLVRAARSQIQLMASGKIDREGHPAALRLQYELTRFRGLAENRREYSTWNRQVAGAGWKRNLRCEF